MEATLAQLAALVEGELHGDGEVRIRGAAPLCEAKPGEITLLDRADREPCLKHCQASAILGPADLTPNGRPLICVQNVHAAFTTIVKHFRPTRNAPPRSISPQAAVSPTARLGNDVAIHPFAVIGDDVVLGDRVTVHSGARLMAGCRIGDDVTIFPNCVLYEDTVVGPRCILHAGVVLGAFGFGYDSSSGIHKLSPQLGNVVLEADVEVGANSTIDCGTYGATVIGQGTKIDNLVQIAHNCRIGRHNLLCAQVGIAGSSSSGDHVVMAGQAGIKDHVHVGDMAILGAMAGVINDVPPEGRFAGIPATPIREQAIKQAALARLPEIRKQLRQLQIVVENLARRLAGSNDPGDSPRQPRRGSRADSQPEDWEASA
ncbi:MAG: UDP-3-O-(3-hydroxymyristoyl)glucosamine N-acyltransferase [Pirellulales bacterium]|nr:UDP-3-O-(3-hydroxymyristoyl)glucosamine N-acyltransferase [Pirellulales bacterium]